MDSGATERCAHQEHLDVVSLSRTGLAGGTSSTCTVCPVESTDGAPLWMCVTCGLSHCSRYANKHALEHFNEVQHPITLDCHGTQTYCYICDDFIPDDSLIPQLAKLKKSLRSKRPLEEGDEEAPVKKPKSLRKIKGVPGAVGLRNLGNTCFMNAVLQSLGNTTALREFFLTDFRPTPGFLQARNANDFTKRTRSSNSGAAPNVGIADEFYLLVQEMWLQDTPAISPGGFLAAVWKVVPSFRGYHQQDAHEFLRYVLAAMHANLVTARGPQNEETRRHESLSLTDIDNRTSIVTELFGGTLWSEVQCRHCNSLSYKEDPFMDISLDIMKGDKKLSTIQDCFSFFTEQEQLEDTELYLCATCRTKQPCKKRFSVRRNPKILCLQLKRFRWGTSRTKLKDHVKFPLVNLDLQPFLDDRSTKLSLPAVYDLYAVVNHHGTGSGSGHYTAMILNDYFDDWIEFNDGTVLTATRDSVEASQAYLLFYKLRS